MKLRITMVVIIVLLIVLSIFTSLYSSFNDTTYEVTITDKERITQPCNGKAKSKYIVYADSTEGESLVFENTDKLIRGKFNSSNIQGMLKVGNAYKLTVIGVRIPFFSYYQNIIEVEEIN